MEVQQDAPGGRFTLSGPRIFVGGGTTTTLPRLETGDLRLDFDRRDGHPDRPAPLSLPLSDGGEAFVATSWRDERTRVPRCSSRPTSIAISVGCRSWTSGRMKARRPGSATRGYCVQSSNINGPANGADLPGTYLVTGPRNWTNVTVRARMSSHDNDGLGLAFRWVDAANHYRFVMDSQRSRRWLLRTRAGVTTILAQDTVSYEQRRWYDVEVEAIGTRIAVRVDGEPVFLVQDGTIPLGGAGLFCWANSMSLFEDFRVLAGAATARELPELLREDLQHRPRPELPRRRRGRGPEQPLAGAGWAPAAVLQHRRRGGE